MAAEIRPSRHLTSFLLVHKITEFLVDECILTRAADAHLIL